MNGACWWANKVFKKYSAKSILMLNMLKRLDTSNHHQLYVQHLSVNLQSMPTISSLSSSTFSLPPLYVFVLVHLLTHLHLCTRLSPHPPSLPYLYTSSYMFVLVLLVSSLCLSFPCVSPPCLSRACLPPPCLFPTCLSFPCLSPPCLSPACLPPTCLSPTCLSLPCLSPPCLPPRCSSTRNWKRLLILICRAAHPLTTTVIPPFPHLKNKKVTSARISLHFRPLPSFANISSIYDPILQPPLIFYVSTSLSLFSDVWWDCIVLFSN